MEQAQVTVTASRPPPPLSCKGNGKRASKRLLSIHPITAILYELLYTRVLGVEEAELQAVLEGFRGGGRRYRNSLSACSEDAGYDTPEDRAQRLL